MNYWAIRLPANVTGNVLYPGKEFWARDDGATLFEVVDRWGSEVHPAVPISGTVAGMLRNRYGARALIGKAKLAPGEYYPRMWRSNFSPPPNATHQLEWTMSVQAARNLFLDMRDLFRCIEPVAANADSYGHRIRELLILACTEVESAWKSVLVANGYVGPNPGRFTTQDYVKLLDPLRLNDWELSLAMHRGFPPFKPFQGWIASSPGPTVSLPWYARYNKVKHGRETNFADATLETLVQAMGGVFVMVSAQFGPWIPLSEGQANGTPIRHYAPWAEDLVSLKTVWADDFAIVTHPEWPLEDRYVPPECESGASWAAVPFWK